MPVAPVSASESPPPRDRATDVRAWLPAGTVLVLAIALAYGGSLAAPFHFDDHESILQNASIRDLGSFAWLTPPGAAGETVGGRPVLNLSLALNYAVGGLDVRGYRAANVLIHALAALVLFGLIRRTWLGGSGVAGVVDPGPGSASPATAVGHADTPSESSTVTTLALAALWALHPLHTSAVTYVVQRAESLAALFYLLTLYCFVRGAECGTGILPVDSNHGRKPRAARRAALPWFALAVVACLLGVGTKETVATAPLLALLYDRTFLAGSFRVAWRVRRRVYVGLASTWFVLAILVVANRGRGESAGLDARIDPWTYLLTQCEAIVQYLRLAFWPGQQVFDYGIATAAGIGAVLPELLLLMTLATAAGWALYRNRPAGFLAGSFFLLLAPSSSIVPVATQTMAEHRMYLPLAGVVALAAMAGWALVKRISGAVAGLREAGPGSATPATTDPGSTTAVAGRRGLFPGAWAPWLSGTLVMGVVAALGSATFARNRVYLSELALWQNTSERRPDNPRAHHNYGLALSTAGRTEEAMTAYRRALALQPNHVFAHVELGQLLVNAGRWEDAVPHFRAAVEADPHHAPARVNLGRALAQLGRDEEAIAEYRAVLAQEPDATDARTNLAALLTARGESEAAAAMLRDVLAVAPELAEAHYHFGIALEASGGDRNAAEAAFREAVRLKPDFAPAHVALGHCVARRSDVASTLEAERVYRRAIELDARLSEAWYGLGNVLARQQAFPAAIDAFQNALRISPDHVQARNNLGNCFLVTGRWREAIANYERVLERRPADHSVRRNLELAREQLRAVPFTAP